MMQTSPRAWRGAARLVAAGILLLPAAGCGGGADPAPEPGPAAEAAPRPDLSMLFIGELPQGYDADRLIPEDNPLTPEKVALGMALYFDPRLSADGTVSCATCHDPALHFTDGKPTSAGIAGQLGNRNAPTVINATYNYLQFWDGRAQSLEEQALGPIANPVEMGNTHEAMVQSLAGLSGYQDRFQAVFGRSVNKEDVARAIAAFERTILSGNSAWDRHNRGEEGALSPEAKRGLDLFMGKARCSKCHVGFNLSDSDFHNLGVGMDQAEPDLGRYQVTAAEKDRGAFKTPTLRDVQHTAPYMHDGSQATLVEVIDWYDKGGHPNPWLDSQMQPLNLTGQEKADLLAFLRSLDGEAVPTGLTAPPLP